MGGFSNWIPANTIDPATSQKLGAAVVGPNNQIRVECTAGISAYSQTFVLSLTPRQTPFPTLAPTVSPAPTPQPLVRPTSQPTKQPFPRPTHQPTLSPLHIESPVSRAYSYDEQVFNLKMKLSK